MTQRRVRGVVLGIVAAGMMGGAGFAGDELTLKDAMGEDLEGLQRILIGLINSDYHGVPADVGLLQEHASQLTQKIPESVTDNQDQFRSYAYNLAENSKNLKSIVELLIRHDKDRARECPPGVGTDHLRDVAAAYYGGMVNMCVVCHNRFRIPLGQ